MNFVNNSDMININKNEIDPNYRYKMHRIKTKIEGRGNGIKTILLNLNIISKELYRNSEEILKFLGQTKGSQTIIHDDKFIINGSFSDDIIQNEIYNYIDKYVICIKCLLPETIYFKRGKNLYNKCNACSAEYEIIDKLKPFILKNLTKS
jgi:translation initiation factor 5